MKYLYLILVLALIGGVYLGYIQYSKSQKESEIVAPAGSHLMPDGSIMPNEEGVENADIRDLNKTEAEEVKSILKDSPQKSTVTLDPNARVFTVKGVNYGYDIKKIVVKEGDTVTINFESTDGYHDVVINEFGIATKRVQPGVKTSVTFVADKKGTYEYYCSVGSHRTSGMVGTFIVE